MLPVGMMSFGSVRHQAPQVLERSPAEGGLIASNSILGLSSSVSLIIAHFRLSRKIVLKAAHSHGGTNGVCPLSTEIVFSRSRTEAATLVSLPFLFMPRCFQNRGA